MAKGMNNPGYKVKMISDKIIKSKRQDDFGGV
jgi:hypothetical protein